MDERSSQVSIMGKIYTLAKRVLVWLGEETKSSAVFFRFCHLAMQIERLFSAPGLSTVEKVLQISHRLAVKTFHCIDCVHSLFA